LDQRAGILRGVQASWADPDLEAYLKIKKEILEHPSEYFMMAKGSFLGRFPTLHDAFKQMRENKTTKGFVIRSQPSCEWLGGSIES